MANDLPQAVLQAIAKFCPRGVDEEAARFARDVVARARPESVDRAKALLYAASRLACFAESVGLELDPALLLSASVIERCCTPGIAALSAATRRTLRSNLRAIARRVAPVGPQAPRLSRERAKTPYTREEIAGYLALADAQGTESRKLRASALVCLSGGAGLVGADLKAVRGTDVVVRSGGVVVCVRQGRCPRVVPVLSRYHSRVLSAAGFMRTRLLIGGTSASRRNVTTPLTASLSGGADLPRLCIARLRATWLCEVAEMIGLRGFMDAAGITCSQRLGDLVSHLEVMTEAEAVALIGGPG